MATPKKKHLIELMIEAGVKWPDGAEYAAQDKRDRKLYFFERKPTVLPGDESFCAPGGPIGYQCSLPLLCRNWHQTIVTREQYAEALSAANTSGKTNQVRESKDVPASQPAAQLYLGVAGVMPSETIESLLTEIKAKREEHDALVAKAEALALEIVGIEQQVNDNLKEYGFVVLAMSTQGESEQPVITDWRDLRVGDVILIGESSAPFTAPSGEYQVTGMDVESETQPVSVEWDSGEVWPLLAERGWRFIRRP